jgi:hypothetical protein
VLCLPYWTCSRLVYSIVGLFYIDDFLNHVGKQVVGVVVVSMPPLGMPMQDVELLMQQVE